MLASRRSLFSTTRCESCLHFLSKFIWIVLPIADCPISPNSPDPEILNNNFLVYQQVQIKHRYLIPREDTNAQQTFSLKAVYLRGASQPAKALPKIREQHCTDHREAYCQAHNHHERRGKSSRSSPVIIIVGHAELICVRTLVKTDTNEWNLPRKYSCRRLRLP
jgi:hypothetical protein